MATVTESKLEPTTPFVRYDADGLLQQMAKDCPPFYKNRNLLSLYLRIMPGCLVPAMTLGFDSAMMNGLQSVPAWDAYFGSPRGAVLGALTAILAVGALCGVPFLTYIGDRFGRRTGIFFGACFMLIGGVIQGASKNIAMFVISRFLIGFGFIFANAFAPVMIAELAHPKDRQVATSLYQSSWYVGAICAAWITFGTFSINSEWSWRIPSLLQAVPALIQMIGIWFLPESPRWLIAKGRHEEAKEMLITYHGNGIEDEFVKLEFSEMKSIIEMEMAQQTTWKSLISTPGNRRRMMILVALGLFSQWSGSGLISYYLARVLDTVGVTSSREQNIINGCLGIFNWITATGSSFLTAHMRRRTQFLISVGGMLACFSAQTLCAGLFNARDNKAAGLGVIPMLFLFYAFYNLAFNALVYAYPVEILPYPIRAKGMSVLMLVGKVAYFVNAFVNPVGLAAIGWKFYLVYVVWLSFEVVVIYFVIVETKGPTLEGIADRFDKKEVLILDGRDISLSETGVEVFDKKE